MRGLLYLGRALFLPGALLLAAEQCGLPDKVVQQLVHYQAWSAYWIDIEPEVPKTQELRVLKDGSAWLVYSVPYRAAYRVTDSGLSTTTCGHLKDWIECVAGLRPPLEASSISDFSLGKMKSSGPIDAGRVCELALTVSPSQAKWHPSEESEQKQQLLRLLTEEVGRTVKVFGTAQGAVCNNFNVNDPRIWAVVDIVEQAGTPDRLLIGVKVDHTVPPRMIASTMTFAASNQAPLVKRIRRDSLRLSLQSR